MTTYIATGAVEPIEALILDVNGAPLTGLANIKAAVRRESDGFLLDWAGPTFKSAGWTTLQQVLAEVDAVNQPGWYRLAWNTGALTNAAAGDKYVVTVTQVGASTAKNVPQSGTLAVALVDPITLLRKGLTNKLEETAGNPGTLVLRDDDGVTVLKTWTLTDSLGGAVVASVGEPARRSAGV